jgi:hypothetical protein
MNDIRALIPPGFRDRAVNTNLATSYNLNIPQLYTQKNPAWHPLTINEADILDPDVIMPKLNQDQMFAPDTDDVMLLEREVNLYRLQMRDDELEHLQEQRRELLKHLNEMQQDDFDDQLHEIDTRIRARQQELSETERKMRELEAENDRLERELSVKPVVTSIVTTSPPPPRPAPQPIQRIVVEERPRSKSPGRNILPSVISGLPIQRETRRGFNYENDQVHLNDSVRGDIHLSKPLYESYTPAMLNQYNPGPTSQTIPPMRDSYSTTVNRGIPIQAPAPPPRVVSQGQPIYLREGVQPSSIAGPPTYQNVSYGQPSTTVRQGSMISTPVSQARTYRINGMTYTDATLPPQYAHLRGN